MAFESGIITKDGLKTALETLRDEEIGRPSSTGVTGTTLSDQVRKLNSTINERESAIRTTVEASASTVSANSDSIEDLKASIAQLREDIRDLGGGSHRDTLTMDQVYPVGSIYISTSSTNPYTLFGVGSWVQISGRFLLASGGGYSAGSTGGEASHRLTISEIPSHSHGTNSEGTYNQKATGSGENTGYGTYPTWLAADYKSNWRNINTTSSGGGGYHNNMPPYLVVNVWKRTA